MGRLDPAGPRRAHIVPATTVLTRATRATITAAGHVYPLYTLHMEPAPSMFNPQMKQTVPTPNLVRKAETMPMPSGFSLSRLLIYLTNIDRTCAGYQALGIQQ